MDATEVVTALAKFQFTVQDEDELQGALHDVLVSCGLPCEREVALPDGARIDLQVGTVGVEVKVSGSVMQVLPQLQRYGRSGRFSELLLVTSVAAHRSLPEHAGGVPLHVWWMTARSVF